MNNKEKRQARFMRDSLSARLGGLAATLGRISSSARQSNDPQQVASLLDEAKHLIEWTAADADAETAAELVGMQRLITLWERVWAGAEIRPAERALLATQAKQWSDQALAFSGLI
jgi:hypothetical protein